jgi:hypothetical protein
MKFTKSFFLIFTLVLLSCSQKAITINSSIKRINYPGIASASPFIGYEISFESSSDFKIDKVQLNNDIKEFSLYSVSTRKSISSANLLSKGKYILSFSVKNSIEIDEADEVAVFILNNGKLEKKISKVIKKAPFRAR